MKNYYYILGVKNTASEEEIRIAYKKLTFLLHPDRNGGDIFFEERFKEIQEAYATLSNSIKRQSYDLELSDFIRPKGSNTVNTTTPSIIQFEASKKAVEEGEVITLVWKTIHADTIHLDPIGMVEASGTKTIRLNGLINKPRMHLILTATNTFMQKSINRQVTIQNKSFKGQESLKLEQFTTEANYQKYDNKSPIEKDNKQIIVREAPKPKAKKPKKELNLGISKNNLISVLIVILTIIVLAILAVVVYQLNMGK